MRRPTVSPGVLGIGSAPWPPPRVCRHAAGRRPDGPDFARHLFSGGPPARPGPYRLRRRAGRRPPPTPGPFPFADSPAVPSPFSPPPRQPPAQPDRTTSARASFRDYRRQIPQPPKQIFDCDNFGAVRGLVIAFLFFCPVHGSRFIRHPRLFGPLRPRRHYGPTGQHPLLTVPLESSHNPQRKTLFWNNSGGKSSNPQFH